MENAELIKALKEDAEWAHANEWETPITLGDHLDAAISALRAQEKDHIANVNETAEPCECIIGLYYDSEDAKLVTLKELKEEIKENKQYNEYMARNYSGLSYVKLPEYSLRDYFDGRKSTNLTRFKHCPMCGRALTKPKGE